MPRLNGMLVHRYKINIFTKQKYRVVYVKPPKEADCQDTMLWKLIPLFTDSMAPQDLDI